MRNNDSYQNDTSTLVLKSYAWYNVIYNNLILRIFLLPLLCSMLLVSHNFTVKLIIFSQFWPGAKALVK